MKFQNATRMLPWLAILVIALPATAQEPEQTPVPVVKPDADATPDVVEKPDPVAQEAGATHDSKATAPAKADPTAKQDTAAKQDPAAKQDTAAKQDPAKQDDAAKADPDAQKDRAAKPDAAGKSEPAPKPDHASEIDADRRPALVTNGSCLIKNVTIHTATKPAFTGDVLVRDGRIAGVGTVTAHGDVQVIDGTGKHLAPGVVDCHSHIAIDGNANEGTVTISAEVRIADVVDPTDSSIYRALGGGVTTARLLHGSANAIGGQDEVIKLKFDRPAEALRFPGGPQGIKFALGENPKRAGGSRGEGRFPSTRMGVEAVYYRAFDRAREYMDEWETYRATKARGEDPEPPRRDVRLDVLAGILRHDILVHSHCYRADEILMLIQASKHFGFQIATLQHVLEGYKVAHEMAQAHVGGSTFGDWWAYKIEAYDGIPQNAYVMDEAGVSSSLNSDDAEMMRRLYLEAAKSVRYARMDPVRALDLVTLFPAQQLGIGDHVGSIEDGKDADLVLLNGDPLSALSRVEWTMVDGRIEFQRRDAFGLDANPPKVRAISEAADGNAPAQTSGEIIAIAGGTLHPVTSPDVEKGLILMQGGRILAMGANLAIPAGARTIDASGKHVYPGLIALGSNVGLLEIGSIAATDDQSEGGGNQPDVRVSASINAESAHIGVTRTNGITRCQVAPQGGGPMRGQSALIRLAGDTWEELVVLDREMLHIQFPSVANDAKDKKKSDALEEVEQLLEDAKEYGRLIDAGAKLRHDSRLEALVPYARGEKKVALHARNAQTILYALRFAKEHKLKAVLYGAAEGWKVADMIAREQVPVVVGPVLALPQTRFDPYDSAFANAAVLSRAGVSVSIMANDPENTRNMPFHAAMAASFGLPREEALRAITYYPAQLLGMERDLGSLAPGKIADVIITDGDILDIRSRVETLFIDGAQQDVSNRQTALFEKAMARLERLMKKTPAAALSSPAR